MPRSKLSVAQALEAAELIEWTLSAFEQTAPKAVASLGGRDALARLCRMACFGPVPQLDVETWRRMSEEYEERRNYGDLADRHRSMTR